MLIGLVNRYIYQNKVSKETFWAMLAKGASVLGGAFILVFVPRFAGVEIYGGFMLLIAYLTVSGIFFGESLKAAVKKEMAEEKFSAVSWHYFMSGILLKAACAVFSTIILFVLLLFANIQIVREYFLLFVILNMLIVLWGSVSAGFEAVHRLFYLAVIYCIEYMVKVAMILWFYLVSQLTVETLLLSFIGGYGVAFAVGMVIFIIECKPSGLKDFFFIDLVVIKKLLKRGVYLTLTSVAAVILVKVDSIMISFFLAVDDVGLYNVAGVIAKNATLVTIPLVLGAAPMFVQKNVGSGLLAQTIRNIAIVNVGLFILLALMAPYVIRVVFGNEFTDSIFVLQILSLYPLFCALQVLFQQILILKDKLKEVFFIGLLAVVVDVVLNALLIRPWGIAGAAAATTFSFFLWAIGSFVYVRKLE